MDKPRVLVADDNDAICALLKALLQRDYHVEIARDGSEAIERLRTAAYSAVLLDLLMPEVDGFSVLKYLRNERPSLLAQVIVLTAAVTERELAAVRTYAVRDVIRKPFEVETLLASLRQCVGPGEGTHGASALLTGGMLLLVAQILGSR